MLRFLKGASLLFTVTTIIAALGTLIIVLNNQLSLIPVFYLILFQCAVGVLIILQAPKNEINFSYAAFVLLFAVWNYCSFIVTNRQTAGLMWEDKFIFIPAAFLLAFFLYFTLVFPKRKTTINAFHRVLIYLLPSIFFVLVPYNLIISDVVINNGTVAPVFGKAYFVFVVFVLFYVLASIHNLIKSYVSSTGMEKIQIKYVLFGISLSLLSLTTSNVILPWFGEARLTAYGSYFTLFFIVFTAYAITKHRLMDISVVISRLAAEILTIATLSAVYLGLLFVHQTYFSGEIDIFFIVWTIVYGIFVGQIFMRLRLFFQTTSDRLFLRGKYDYYKALAGAGEQITKTLSMENINLTLKKTFSEIMEVANPRLLLTEAELKPYQEYHQITPVKDDLVVPCRLEERLIAVFILGPKLSEDAYTDEDLRLLSALASQAAVAIDHTRSYERIKEDLLAAEKQLERSQRLASIGTLTAGVTHEIRNPMTVIRAKVETLFDRERDEAYLKDARRAVLESVDRVEKIIQGMLNLSKNKEQRINEDIDLAENLETALAFFPKNNFKLVKELKPITAIKGVKVEIQQAMVNIIQNAIEAMPGGGTLTIKTYEENGRPVIEISDTGKGIPIEIREKIFDPFFSGRHEGTGLGLSIVYRIIREHGGDIKVESEIGKGTTFKLLF